jgi:hypothetical protein
MSKGLGRFARAAVIGALLLALAGMAAPVLAASATATLSPSGGLAFGNVKVGTTSSSKKATLSNSGSSSQAFHINSISVNGQFAISSKSCGSSLGVGSSCTISVVFKPTSSGAKAGTLNVSTDASAGDTSIPLSGTGAMPGAKLSATSLSFGGWAVGVTSPSKSVNLTNTGKATLKITSVSASGDFKQSNDCGSSLGAGKACTISVTFRPGALGSRTGKLTVKDDASTGTQTASLSGNGVKLSVSVDPTTLNFRIERIHTTSVVRSATLTNKGPSKLIVSDISTSNGYSQTNTCGSSLSAGTSCTISVTFNPTTEGSYDGSVTIQDNAGTQHVSLTGIGGLPEFKANLKRLTFHKQGVGTSSLPRVVKVTNVGTDKLFINKIRVKGDFSQTNTCEPYVNPGITCVISVTFSPTRADARKGVLTIDHELGVNKLSLRGSGIPAIATQGTNPAGDRPEDLGPDEVATQRGLSGPLKLLGLVGLLLLIGGGAFLWLTKGGATRRRKDLVHRLKPRGDAEASDSPKPDGRQGADQAASLDAVLAGIKELETLGRARTGVTEAQAVNGSSAGSQERVPVGRAPYDWQSDPGSALV